MKLIKTTAIVMAALTAITGCSCKSGSLDKNATSLLNSLRSAAESGKFYYAHQDALVYGHNWKVEDVENDSLDRSDVRMVCGAHPAVVGFDLGGIELGDKANLDGVDFSLMSRAAVTHVKRGGIVTFSWHVRNPLTGGDAWDISSDKAVESVLEGGANHELFMQWLSRVADFFGTMKDADGNLIPLIFRPWHENIGSWFWWGGNLCTSGQYKTLFALTRNYIEKERGLRNILWAYSPNSEIDSTQYFSRYPGDDMVDILGVDHYEYVDRSDERMTEDQCIEAANRHYKERLAYDLDYMAGYAKEHGKVIAVSETGFEGIPYPRWWTDVLLDAIGDAPVAYVLTWRNAWDKQEHYFAAHPSSADADNFREFYENDKTIFLK